MKANYNPETGRVIGFNLPATPYVEITEQERYQPLPDKYSFYAVENGKFCILRRTPTTEEEARDRLYAIQQELSSIKKWFSDNDYKVLKLFLGEWKTTDLKWLEYLAERAKKRARQDELQSQLEEITLQ